MSATRYTFLTLAFLTVWPAQALAADPPPSFTARREMPYGIEQISIIFRPGKAELVLNSNFLQSREKAPILLGRFEAPLTPRLELARDELGLLRQDLISAETMNPLPGPGAITPPAPSPHSVRVFVDAREASEESSVYRRVLSLLSSLERSGEWKAIDGLVIREEGEQLLLEPGGLKSRKDLGCEGEADEDILCRHRFGTFQIWAPAKVGS